MITKDDVKHTKAFEGLDNVQKDLILKRESFEKIQNGVSVAKHKGLALYEKEHKPSTRTLIIVTELINRK